MKRTRTRLLVEGALMIAVAYVLSYIKLFALPQGGSVTLEMLPLILMGLRNGPKWGVFTGFTHGVIQMVLGFSNVMYCPTLLTQIGCILMDYLLAYSVLGLAGLIAAPFGQRRALGAAVGTVVCGCLQFLCSFLSGWLVWASYYDMSSRELFFYSLGYNASYMVPNIVLSTAVVLILCRAIPDALQPQR